ncbi:thiaminase II [Psychrobacillus sp. FSL K6-2843]|uniref:thiaminase II n=1 Tax=Psychrobacillus sp. FSL K6-2843 TaxID=2921549 RepID=UPI00315A5BD2
MEFCEKVRQETQFYWEASFNHPFVQGIADGSLPLEKFKFYMLQDAYYLKHYTKVLALAAAKATNDEDIQYFLNSARFIHEAELELHRTTFQDLNVTAEEIENFEVAPATYNYVSHMYNAVHNGDVTEAFAAILPCPWLYQEIGQQLKYARPNIPLYAQWIALYASDEMLQSINKQKSMLNRFAKEQPMKQKVLKAHFEKSCYYEWMFWEMPWTMQNWTKGVYMNEPTKN